MRRRARVIDPGMQKVQDSLVGEDGERENLNVSLLYNLIPFASEIHRPLAAAGRPGSGRGRAERRGLAARWAARYSVYAETFV